MKLPICQGAQPAGLVDERYMYMSPCAGHEAELNISYSELTGYWPL